MRQRKSSTPAWAKRDRHGEGKLPLVHFSFVMGSTLVLNRHDSRRGEIKSLVSRRHASPRISNRLFISAD